MSITSSLSEYVMNLSLENVPENVIEKAKNLIIDTVGVMVAGSNHQIINKINKMNTAVENISKADVRDMIMKAGIMCSVHDYDDMNDNNYIHSGRMVIPAALILGISNKISGKELLEAIIAGYDVHARIASASKRRECGHRWNVTSICGAFATAATASKINKFDIDKIQNALGIAFSFASGNMLSKKQDTDAYFIQQGIAAYNGIVSSEMAKVGLSGPKDIFEDEKSGYYPLYFKDVDRDMIISELEEHYYISDTSIKLYPSDRSNHSALAAVSTLVGKYNFKHDDIEKITIYTTTNCHSKIGKQFATDMQEKELKCSASFVLASFIINECLSLDSFMSDNVNNKDILELAKKIEVVADQEFDEKYLNEAISPAKVEISLKNNGTISEMAAPKGAINNELSKDEIIQKFISCTSNVIEQKQSIKFIELVENIGSMEDISCLNDYIKIVD